MAFVKIEETKGSTVNVSGVHLIELLTDEVGKPAVYDTEYHHLQGAQDIKTDKEQETVENWGDGQVQERATVVSKYKVDYTAFMVPLEIEAWLNGAKVDEDGTIIETGGVITPPNVGTFFYKERANKDIEVVALVKGTFVTGGDEAKTAEEKIEFGNGSIEGEFSSRLSDGQIRYKELIKKDDKDALDKFLNKVFGKPAPATAIPPSWTKEVTPTV
ncbi:hypothetical protein ETI08_01030 [Macrococcoides goetzii]|nr:major tail protein [Macrococcus goetzii]TDM47747.1 hypothetical protein ETI08_01030 [Macrococcus goetzii]